MAEPIVYVVDDDEAVRGAIEWLLGTVGLNVRTFGAGQEFLDGFETTDAPGCIVLDVRMPGKGGLEIQQELKARDCPLPAIILTSHGDAPMAARAIKDGAYDFIEKPFNNQALLDIVQKAIHESQALIEARRQRDEIGRRLHSLSERERQVLDLILQGKSNQEMAGDLSISRRTVEVHRANLMEKMAAGSIAELMRAAFAVNLIGQPTPRRRG
ncbi:response regulator transcription factor [Shumkonia mesophila]|uniref:response regulator transcription factor n=1 Tax=Shumkonia mesophila TaxID=2838854 RepID=UPI002934EE85|nr:response regulator [Shumkonia mesophila]